MCQDRRLSRKTWSKKGDAFPAAKVVPARKRSAIFTIIELIVVMAIIAILVTILLPALKRAKDNGKRILCLSNQKQIGIALSSYAGDWGGVLPPLSYKYSYFLLSGGTRVNLGQLLSDYLSAGAARAVLFCPAANPHVDANWGARRFVLEYPTGTAMGHYHYRPGAWPATDLDIPKPGIRLAGTVGNPALVAEYFHHDGTGSLGARVFHLSHCAEAAAFQGQNVLYLDGSARWRWMAYPRLSAIDPHYASSKATHQAMWAAFDNP